MDDTAVKKIAHNRLKLFRDPDRGRFELRQDGVYIGFVGYTVDDVPAAQSPDGEPGTAIRLQHTIIDEAYSRQGYARALVTMILERARAEGDRIIPECSYVQDYLRRYPEYEDVVLRRD
ncbi:GNAT family N-acetyltransferase [uncultured Micrococcus sp.]|uniref:GNAT family N-acetyltransferase n=1 Tax=uncultured Micrococcus sp. TaxID=114051 RepID=UPI00130ECC5E|nr:GNAT family N-acetyltransferase [uncultured Micrococcus sp.]